MAPTEDDIGAEDLEKLLQLAEEQDTEELSKNASLAPRLKEDDTFFKAFSIPEIDSPKPSESLLNEEELDSSDEEGVRNFLERKYNEYGRGINKTLKQQSEEKREAQISKEVDRSSMVTTPREGLSNNCSGPSNSFAALFNKNKKRAAHENPTPLVKSHEPIKPLPPVVQYTDRIGCGIYTDPIFGMRLINPLVSSSVLTERMSGRKPVGFSSLEYHTQCGDLSKDWVIAGVILSKSPVKTTKTGASYSIWKLSDLKGDIKMCSLFLFKTAHKELWKTAIGMVIAVLNPSVFEKRTERNDAACLSIDTHQKVMILGQSKDMGTCKAKKKNGEPCGVVVNLGDCEFCIYHVKQEFGKMSRRPDLQSSTAGRGLNELRNKVLGKSEVFYGGQSYTAIPAKKSAKQIARDEKRLMTLSDYYQSPNAGNVNHVSSPKLHKEIAYAKRGGPSSKVASVVEGNTKQRLKDLERLKQLKEEGTTNEADQGTATESTESTQPTSGQPAREFSSLIPEKFRSKEFSFSQKAPTLTKQDFSIEVNLSSKQAQIAKLKAAQILKKKPIAKTDPNYFKYRGTTEGKKRALADLDNLFENDPKKQKLDQQAEADRKSRIQRIMEATSSHTNLIQQKQDEAQEKYFNKLEKKEAMEEKMLSTFKVACKAVICRKCKYVALSAADRCKEERHPLKVIDAEKRFFKCQDCGNRTATVHKIPKISCKNCKGSRWQRAGMIREKRDDPSRGLSIRGDEETFLGSVNSSANLNLMVPEE